MHDSGAALVDLQTALEHMRAALTSGDLAALLAAQTQCAAAGRTLAMAPPRSALRPALRVSLERARATLADCQTTNDALLRVVGQARLDADGELDYNRAGDVAALPAATDRETRVSCRA